MTTLRDAFVLALGLTPPPPHRSEAHPECRTGKRRHTSLEGAQAQLRSLQVRRDTTVGTGAHWQLTTPLEAYQCRACGGWHVGNGARR